MNNILPYLGQVFPLVKSSDESTLKNTPLDNLAALHLWHQAGFCDERGYLTHEELNQTLFLEEIARDKLDCLLKKQVSVGGYALTIKEYLDRILLNFPHFSFKLYLRGSYATYILNPLEALHSLIHAFILQHPETEALMMSGWKWVEEHCPPLAEPNDADFALLGNIPLSPDQQIAIRSGLITVHAELAGISLQEAEETTFQSLFLPRTTQWTDLNDPIVISTIGGKDIKLDLVTGHLREAPYLFSLDNRLIRITHLPYLTVLQGSLSQGTVDYGLQVVRFERRHAKDLRALLKAIHHLTCGKQWDESIQSPKNILFGFLKISEEELSKFILKWLEGKTVDRIPFVVNLLCLVDDLAKRENLWKHLSDGKISFLEASRQIYERKQAFPEAYGAMPFLKMDFPETAVHLSMDFMKRALFIPLRPLSEEPSGIYAEWRRCCEWLHAKKPLPTEFIDTLCSLYLANKFTKSEEAILANQLSSRTLIDALVERGSREDIFLAWLKAHQHESWEEQFRQLPKPLNSVNKTFLIQHCRTDPNAKDFFLSAFRSGHFYPEKKMVQLFIDITANDREDTVISFLSKLSPLISPDLKDWMIDLWIAGVKNRRISSHALQSKMPHWFNGKIPEAMKQRIALKIIQAIGIQSLDEIDPLTPHLANASIHDLKDCFLKSLEKSADSAALFYHYHQNALTPYLDELLIASCQNQHVLLFIQALSNTIDMRSLIRANLFNIPPQVRLTCIHKLPREDQLACVKDPRLLSSEERNTLGTRLVNETKSIFELWALQRCGITIHEKLVHSIQQAFLQKQNLKDDQVRQEALCLIETFSIDALTLLVPRLEPSLRELLQPRFRQRIEQSIQQNSLDEIALLLPSKLLCDWAQLTLEDMSQLNPGPADSVKLLQLIFNLNAPTMPNLALCIHWIRLNPDAIQNTKLCNLIFSWCPHPLPEILGTFLVEAVAANPKHFVKALNAHASWLISLIKSSGESLFILFTNLLELGLNLPTPIPQTLIDYLIHRDGDQRMIKEVLRLQWNDDLFNHFLQEQNPANPVCFEDVQSFRIPNFSSLSYLFDDLEGLKRSLPQYLKFYQSSKSIHEDMSTLLTNAVKRCVDFQAFDLISDHLDLIDKTIKDEELRIKIGMMAIRLYFTRHTGFYRWFKYVDSLSTAARILSTLRKHDLSWRTHPEALKGLQDLFRYILKNPSEDPSSEENLSIATELINLLTPGLLQPITQNHPEILDLFLLYRRNQNWPLFIMLNVMLIIATIGPDDVAKEAFQELIKLIRQTPCIPPAEWALIVPLQARFKDEMLPDIVVSLDLINDPIWPSLEESYLNLECLKRFILKKELRGRAESRKLDFLALVLWAKQNHHMHQHLEIYAEIIAQEILNELPATENLGIAPLSNEITVAIRLWLEVEPQDIEYSRSLNLLRDKLLSLTTPKQFNMILQVLTQLTQHQWTQCHKNQSRYDREYKDLMHHLFAHPYFYFEKHILSFIHTGLIKIKDYGEVFFYSLFLNREIGSKDILSTLKTSFTHEAMYQILTRAMNIAMKRADKIGLTWCQFIFNHVCANYPKNKDRLKPFLTKLVQNMMLNQFDRAEIQQAVAEFSNAAKLSAGMQKWMHHVITELKEPLLHEIIPLTAKDFE